jgi:cardiolipin synthase
MRLEGPAVAKLQEVFAEDWYFATGEDPIDPRYFPPPERAGELVAQVIESGPDRAFPAIHRILFTAITMAQDRIWLTTPYFVPDPAMLVALQAAALRGIDVRLLLPKRGDLPLIQMAGRSFYQGLLDAGCRIFEYEPVMIHAKTMTVDGSWATAGSANMDMRSFRLNFEINLVVYGESLAGRLERLFLADLARANEVGRDRRVSTWQQVCEGAARALAPLL